MYGLICENLRNLIITKHGEDIWSQVKELAGLKSQSFVLHDVYEDNTVSRIVNAYAEVTGESTDEIMHQTGVNFVGFVEENGYDQLLKVLGRNLRDFLNGLDSLHDYLRFSYTKLKPPSFYVEKETANGMILHYASKRFGFLNYVIGQIKEVGSKFYDVVVDVEVLQYTENKNGCHVILDLIFDNRDYVSQHMTNNPAEEDDQDDLCLDIDLFLDIFPFYIIINKDLLICAIGRGLGKVIKEDDVIGKKMFDVFHILRPSFDFKWENLINTNVLFEVKARKCFEIGDKKRSVQLTGNMKYVPSLECMMFLASPLLNNLQTMSDMGVFVNDLALHDASRDLALQNMHHVDELKTALNRERTKSKMLEDSVQSLEIERKRADSLLYRMIPKQIADRLRKGDSTLNTCETFENVTILFSDVVGFTNICTKISPMEVVTMLNSMYIKFDQLSVQCGVYKVETIGDGYMLVSGIPVPTEQHADNVADMALEMMRVIKSIPNPVNNDKDGHLQIRTGIHSGMVVAGVVGVKMPRYCLFGDTVNMASLMESSGSPKASHISETTKNSLTEGKYCTVYRGNFGVKDVFMKTYWLLGTNEECPVSNITDRRNNMPIECLFSKSRESSPVCISASQRLLSKRFIEDLNDEELPSQSSYTTRSAYLEIEKYIIDNNMAIYSDESGGTTDDIGSSIEAYSISQELSSNQSSCKIVFDISRDSETSTNQSEGSKMIDKNQPIKSNLEKQPREEKQNLSESAKCLLL